MIIELTRKKLRLDLLQKRLFTLQWCVCVAFDEVSDFHSMLKTFSLNACLHAVRPEAWFETDLERSFSKSHQCKRMQETNAFRTSALLVTSMLAFHESNSISLIKSKFIQNFCVVIAWLFWLSISHLLKLRLEFFFLLKNSNDMHINWRYSFFDLRSVLLALIGSGDRLFPIWELCQC